MKFRKISKKAQIKHLIIAALVLLVGMVGAYYLIRWNNCVSIAPTGQCYTQEMIDEDKARKQQCIEEYLREHGVEPDSDSMCNVLR